MVIFQVLVALIPGEPLRLQEATPLAPGEEPFCACLRHLGQHPGVPGGPPVGRPGSGLYFPGEKIESLKFMQNTPKVRVVAFLLMFIPGTPKDLISYCMG